MAAANHDAFRELLDTFGVGDQLARMAAREALEQTRKDFLAEDFRALEEALGKAEQGTDFAGAMDLCRIAVGLRSKCSVAGRAVSARLASIPGASEIYAQSLDKTRESLGTVVRDTLAAVAADMDRSIPDPSNAERAKAMVADAVCELVRHAATAGGTPDDPLASLIEEQMLSASPEGRPPRPPTP